MKKIISIICIAIMLIAVVPIITTAEEPPTSPPAPFRPSGEFMVNVGEEYEYTTTTEPDRNDVELYYQFDWDDGTTTDWFGPYFFGEIVLANHTWNSAGIYYIKARVSYCEDGTPYSESPSLFVLANSAPIPPHLINPIDEGYVDDVYTFKSITYDPDEQPVYYKFDWGDTIHPINDEWIGPFLYEEIVTVNHSWDSIGEYDIQVKAKDIFGAESNWSDAHTINITYKTPPIPPEPSGPDVVYVDESELYTIQLSLEGIYYQFIWGDGETSNWIEGVAGYDISLYHTWTNVGTYEIKIRSSYYPEGYAYSESLPKEITVIYKEDVSIEEIKGGLGLKVTFKNNGDAPLNDVVWKVNIYGKRIIREIDETINGTLNLGIGEEITEAISMSGIRWFGRVEITVTVELEYEPDVVETVNAFKLGPFIILR